MRLLDIKKFKNNQQGFTLMEMVVVLAIFTITISIISDIFINAIIVQRKIIVYNEVLSDAHYAMEKMARYVRTGTISYDDYSSINEPEDKLFVIDNDDVKTFFKLCDIGAGCSLCPTNVNKCLIMSIDEGLNWGSVTPKGIEVDDLKFYIKPLTDPFATGGPDIQPSVVIIMKIKNNSSISRYLSEVVLQSTISTRIYNR